MKGSVSRTVCAGLLALLQACAAAPDQAPVIRYAPVSADQEALIAEVGARIFFAHRQTRPSDDAQRTLDKLAAFLEQRPELRLCLEGHAQDFSAPEADLLISQQRAEGVFRYLVQRGIDPARLVTIGYGRQRPLARGSDESARWWNRRVQFVPDEG